MTPSPTPRLIRILLKVGAWVVPRHRRGSWRRQWEAEVEHRRRMPGGRRGLARFAWGAVLHGLHVRRRETTMTGWTRELAQVARGLLRRPGFSLVAVVTLAVGIGAASAVFSLAEAMLLRPLPLPESHELVRVHSTNRERGHGWFSVSVPDFEGLEGTGAFRQRSLYRVDERDLAGGGDPQRIRVASVHDGFFETLGTAPAAGRLLGAQDQRADAEPVALLAEGLWVRRYGADPGVVGSTIRLDGRAHTVVGIVPDRGAWPADADLWTPLAWGGSPPEWADERSNHAWQVVARLAAGLSVDEVDERVRTWSRTVYADPDIDPRDVGTELLAVPLHRSEGGDDAGALFGTLGAAVALVLLLACMNASGLLLGRGMARARELSVRAALGAGRARITGLLLGEALVLALVGGALGVVVGVVGIGRAWEATPPAIRDLGDIHLNPTVLLGALGISVVAALVAGLVPALKASRVPLAEAMKEGAAGSGSGRASTRFRRVLVVGEVAFSLALLVAAGLAVTGFQRQLTAEPGFEAEGLLAFTVRLPQARYPDDEAVAGVLGEALARLETLPGVNGATATSRLPLGAGGFSLTRVFVFDDAPPPDGAEYPGSWIEVDEHWFDALQVPVAEGRAFDDGDRADAPLVAMVSRRLASQMAPDGSVVGRRIRSRYDENLPRTIVGVVDDFQINGVARAVPNPVVLVPRRQSVRSSMAFLVRTSGDPGAAVPALRAAMADLDPDLALHELRTLRDAHAADLAGIRFLTTLFGAFGSVALVLALSGVYGLVSLSVSLRTREIGVRRAMGATAGRVRRSIVRESLVLGLAGVALGLALAWIAARILASGMDGIVIPEPGTFVVAGLVLTAGVAAGSWIPARRAAGIAPVDALRAE